MARRARLGVLTGAAIAAAACLGGGAATAEAAAPTLAQLVGQRLVVAMKGTRPNAPLLARIRAGQVGGVILFSGNIVSRAQVSAVTASLQAAARAGGRPPLLIATDQEGGLVRRIPWAPPKRSAAALGALPTSFSGTAGRKAGAALHAIGINLDLAPVADVPAGPADFIEQQRRAFSTSRFTVAKDAAAFAAGLEGGGALPVMKHFPGLGLATVSTDQAVVRITASRAELVRGLLPYQVALRRSLRPVVMLSTAIYPALGGHAAAWSRSIIHGLLPYQVALRRSLRPVVMLSTAIYPALGGHAAAWSRSIIHGLLRKRLGFAGPTITDSLDAAAAARGLTDPVLALRSAEAGADVLLVTGSQAASKGVYNALLAAAKAGTLPRSHLTASYNRIIGLKGRV
jgi:beta-N-acetylhexosaminidase